MGNFSLSLSVGKMPASSSSSCGEWGEGEGGRKFESSIVYNASKRRLLVYVPNQQRRTLNKLLTELRCRNFVDKHRLSMQIGTKHGKTCSYAMCSYYSRPVILGTTVDGWALGIMADVRALQ